MDERLKLVTSSLYEFSGLEVTVGIAPRQTTVMTNFLVVKTHSAYNTIVGRSGMSKMRVIPSSYHLKMEFLTDSGIGEAKGDQAIARSCYLLSIKEKPKGGLSS